MNKYYKINSENVTYRIIDGEALILNLKTGEYYSLSQSGTFIWKFLGEKITLEELADKLSQEYDINKNVAISDTKALLKDLISESIVKCVE